MPLTPFTIGNLEWDAIENQGAEHIFRFFNQDISHEFEAIPIGVVVLNSSCIYNSELSLVPKVCLITRGDVRDNWSYRFDSIRLIRRCWVRVTNSIVVDHDTSKKMPLYWQKERKSLRFFKCCFVVQKILNSHITVPMAHSRCWPMQKWNWMS